MHMASKQFSWITRYFISTQNKVTFSEERKTLARELRLPDQACFVSVMYVLGFMGKANLHFPCTEHVRSKCFKYSLRLTQVGGKVSPLLTSELGGCRTPLVQLLSIICWILVKGKP